MCSRLECSFRSVEDHRTEGAVDVLCKHRVAQRSLGAHRGGDRANWNCSA
tara:strand:+ start:129 stop:278 length:150 start_codon:yes stop_codon:yes gene_type:complete